MAKKAASKKSKKDSVKVIRRETKYSAKFGDKILAKVSAGKSIMQICKVSPNPTRETFYKWLRENKDFADNYERAIVSRADLLAEQIIEIADDIENDFAENKTEDGKTYAANNARIARAKLQIDARKWAAARMSPKKYGNNIKAELDNNHSGEIQVNIASFDFNEGEDNDD